MQSEFKVALLLTFVLLTLLILFQVLFTENQAFFNSNYLLLLFSISLIAFVIIYLITKKYLVQSKEKTIQQLKVLPVEETVLSFKSRIPVKASKNNPGLPELLMNSFILSDAINSEIFSAEGFEFRKGETKFRDILGTNREDSVKVVNDFINNDFLVRDIVVKYADRNGKSYWMNENIKGIVSNGNLTHIFVTIINETELIGTKKALQESENRFRLMADSAPAMIWVAGDDKLIFFFNKVWLDFTGRELEDEIGNGWIQDIHPEDINNVLEVFEVAYNKLNEYEMEYRLRKHDGKYYWVLEKGTPRFLNDGTFAGFIGSCIEISEIKLGQERLRESEELYKTVVQSVGDGIMITDIDDKILFVNKSIQNITGYSHDELIGKISYKLLVEPKQWNIILNKNAIRYRGIADTYELQFIRKDRSRVWVRINGAPYKNSMGETIGTVGAISDITPLINAQMAIERNEKKYRQVVENVREVIFQTDDNGIVVFLNNYWTEITGIPIPSCLGKHVSDLFTDDYSHMIKHEIWSLVFGKINFALFEARCKTHNGDFKWVQVSARSIEENNENKIIFGVMSDIHKLKLSEHELIEAKNAAEHSDRLKTDFLAHVSHEIRTPLNIMLSYTSLLEEELKKNSESGFDEAFVAIKNGGNRLLRTIDLIINMSLIQSGSYKMVFNDVVLDDILRRLCIDFNRMAWEKKITLTFNCEIDSPVVKADEYTLTQAFQNLLDNAIKYTERGYVNVRVIKDNKDILTVEFEDTGIGISAAYMPNLFQPFSQEESGYSRSYEGNGLGLALTKRYLEMNNAGISVKSVKGSGSTFSVKFSTI